MLKIITDQKHAPLFCGWLAKRCEAPLWLTPATTRTIALVEFTESGGVQSANILFVCAFHHWSERACEITIGSNGEKRNKMLRDYIFTCYHTVFEAWGRTCVFGTISPNNPKSEALATLIGMSKHGSIPDYFGEGQAATLWSVTKEEWKNGPFATKETTEVNTPIAKETVH